jgi:hypothetical protein
MAETGTRMSMRALVCTIVGLAILCLAPASSNASYVHKYGSSFALNPAGTPAAVAVDEQSESVYVLTNEGMLEKFTAAGVPSNFSALGQNWIALSCEGFCKGLAVDNSGGVNQGVIYVGSSAFFFPEFNEAEAAAEVILPTGTRVGPIENSSAEEGRRMCGVAVGSSGELYISVGNYNLIDRYAPQEWSTHPTQVPPIKATVRPTDFVNPCKTTVDSTGTLYVGQGPGETAANALHKYLPAAFGPAGVGNGKEEEPSTIFSEGVSASSVDTESDDVYLDHVSSIQRVDSAGDELESFGESPHVTESFGVAVNSANKTVYVSNREPGEVSIYLKFLAPDLSAVTAETDVGSASFSGHVDPAGAGDVTSCAFEYRKAGEPSFIDIPCDQATPYSSATDVTASVSGLEAEVEYEYRLRVANANAPATSGTKKFRILPPAIEGVYSAEIEETTAKLVAIIDPKNAPTEFFFEYGSTPQYGNTVPVPVGEIAGGHEGVEKVSALATGLEGHITYHFRAVAISPIGRIESKDQTFNYYPPECPNSKVRQQTGSDFLPDCRAYELVTPRVQGNAILNPGIPTPPSSYATDPARMTFGGVAGGINGTEPVIGLGADFYLSTRTSTGWVTTLPGLKGNELNGTTGKAGGTADLHLDHFIDFSQDNLSERNPGDPEAEEEGFFYQRNIPFVWNADGTSEGRWPVFFETIRHAENMNGYFQPSPDFSHLAFTSSNVPFAPNGVVGAPGSAYDYNVSAGTTEIISKLPSGGDIPQQASIHTFEPEFQRLLFESGRCEQGGRMCEEKIAIPGIQNYNGEGTITESAMDTKHPAKVNPGVSTDGSHILMSTSSEPYDVFTNLVSLPPIHLYMRVNDAVTYDVSKGNRVDYIGMTADGSKVFFRSAEQLTADDHDTSEDLFMWSEASDTLTRISQGAGNGDTDACNSTWASQCDVAPVMWSGADQPDTAISSSKGEIYFYSPEQLVAGKGVPDGRNVYLYRDGDLHYVTTAMMTRMDLSPDGEHMAFVTSDRVTAYDNHGFEEMYSYEPATGSLICVSCNPTGAPPVKDVEGSLNGLFMANDGRTFFYTLDALVPRDTNKLFDVYEYVDGRPQLITTGVGSHDRTLNTDGDVRSRAGFASVSADGVNVYFDTYETLVPEDENGEFLKYYDARTGGGFPVDPPLQPCVAADECHGPGSSSPPPTGIVSSGDLGSSGNVHEGKQAGKKRAKRKRKAHRKKGRGRHQRGQSHG